MENTIKKNYENPIDFLSFFEEFKTYVHNMADRNIFTTSEKEIIITHMDREKKWFCNSFDFINLCRIYKIKTTETRSRRRSDEYSDKTEYCLYCLGYRIEDTYIRQLLPSPIYKSESYYNDSTPFSSGKSVTAELDYLETGRFIDKYDLNIHSNYLSERLETTAQRYGYQLGKTEKQIVYHEFGHVFGFFISQKLNCDIGKIKEIKLIKREGRVKLTDSPYKEPNDWKQRKLNLNSDKKRLLIYFIYILSGAVFNILCFKRKPTLCDFEQIFCDDSEKETYGHFVARAGNDFFKIKDCKYDLSWGDDYDFNKLKNMAYELFYIFDKHFIYFNLAYKYNHLDDGHFKFRCSNLNLPKNQDSYSILELFEYTFNGYLIDDVSTINNFLCLMGEIISEKKLKGLLNEINWLLEKYISDIDSVSNTASE